MVFLSYMKHAHLKEGVPELGALPSSRTPSPTSWSCSA